MHAQAKDTPIIGITLDHEGAGGYSKYPWYALRENYCSAVQAHGGIALPLPHYTDAVDRYLGLIDGLIVTGGNFDVDPALYGQQTSSDTVSTKDARTQFEWAITEGAIARDMPVLGICGGQQLLNVVLGGSLIQHIPDTIDTPLPHEQPNPRNEVGHAATLTEGTQLHAMVGTTDIMVNSAHHQAVDQVGNGVRINATAPDGVIEGIELPAKRFCIGVQWHPEFLITQADHAIYHAFIHACRSES
jgi:putative glutamine amidotransferase